jgi:lipoprotein NlpD
LNRGWLILLILLLILVSACRSSRDSWDQPASRNSDYQVTKEGHYRVRKGDSLHAIAFNLGLDWRDIASWNHIASPYIIYPDQQLRLSPPKLASSSTTTKSKTKSGSPPSEPPPVANSRQDNNRQTTASTSGLKTPQATTTQALPASKPQASKPSASKSPEVRSSTSAAGRDPSSWLWPTNGRIISNFKANDPARNGIEIGGKEGQAIKAAAAGEVVYSGNGLIGYGELIIIKHSDRMLSAYAHNRKRLVSEGQQVKAGGQIAEMGRNDRNQALLHFEIRVNGTPGNPLDYLPKR